MRGEVEQRRLWRSSRLWIGLSYLACVLAIVLGVLGGSGSASLIIAANVFLAATFVVGVVGLTHLWWKPRHRVSLPLKMVGTVVGLVPAGTLIAILLAIAFRR